MQPFLNLHMYTDLLEFLMAKGVSDKVTFKPYDQGQIELIPPDANELIPSNHLVRVVSKMLDRIDLNPLLKRYELGGGASRYHPLMLLKVLVYGYLNNVCSSRMLAKQIRENVYFRWLAGCQQPDFRTINTFRKEKLSPIIDEVFVAVVNLLHEQGYVQLKIATEFPHISLTKFPHGMVNKNPHHLSIDSPIWRIMGNGQTRNVSRHSGTKTTRYRDFSDC